MQLYTITVTPERNYNQLTQLERNSLDDGGSVSDINKKAHATYAELVSNILRGYGFDGFTIYSTSGYWQGKAEPSYKIEIAAETDSVISDKLNIIETIAEELRAVYN